MLQPHKQYQQTTIDRIHQNAYERQLEILLLADQQAASLKRNIIKEAKTAIQEQLMFRVKKMEGDFRVQRSSIINMHRMRRIRGKYQLCEKLFQQVQQRLLKISNQPQHNHSYSLFLIASIAQGLVRMFEPNIYIRCLPRDKTLIKLLLPDITLTYNEFMIEQVGRQYPLNLHISQNCELKQSSTNNSSIDHEKSRQDSQCIGGVILADQSGNITLKSTLDCRINILKEMCLPMVREMIWTKGNGNSNYS